MKLPQAFTLTGLAKPKESKLFLALVPALKEKRAQKSTTLALTLITCILLGLFAINPTIGTITDLQKQLDDDTFVNQQMSTKIANLTTLQQEYSTIENNLEPVFHAIPETPTIDLFVAELHGLADLSNVLVNRVQTFSVDIAPSSPTTKYTAFAFSLEVQGDKTSVEKFLKSLGLQNRLVTLDSISLSSMGKTTNTFRMLIRGKTYFKSE